MRVDYHMGIVLQQLQNLPPCYGSGYTVGPHVGFPYLRNSKIGELPFVGSAGSEALNARSPSTPTESLPAQPRKSQVDTGMPTAGALGRGTDLWEYLLGLRNGYELQLKMKGGQLTANMWYGMFLEGPMKLIRPQKYV